MYYTYYIHDCTCNSTMYKMAYDYVAMYVMDRVGKANVQYTLYVFPLF